MPWSVQEPAHSGRLSRTLDGVRDTSKSDGWASTIRDDLDSTDHACGYDSDTRQLHPVKHLEPRPTAPETVR